MTSYVVHADLTPAAVAAGLVRRVAVALPIGPPGGQPPLASNAETLAGSLTTKAVTPAGGAAAYVPRTGTQGGTALDPADVTPWELQCANNYDANAKYALRLQPMSFGSPARVETVLKLGYNPDVLGGEPAAFFTIHSAAHDQSPPEGALEMQFNIHYPDGTQYLPFQIVAPRNNDHEATFAIQHGPGGGAIYFTAANGSGSYMSMGGITDVVPTGVVQTFQPVTMTGKLTVNNKVDLFPATNDIAIDILTGGISAAAIYLRSTAGYFSRQIANPLDRVLYSEAPFSTSGVTTRNGGSINFTTSYWNGSASVLETGTLDMRRSGTTVGAHFWQMGSGLFIQAQSNQIKGLTVRQASGTAAVPIFEAQDSAGNPLSRIDKNGYFTTRKVAAPADGDLAASEMAIWFDNTNGAAKLMIKAKEAGGTVRTASVALA